MRSKIFLQTYIFYSLLHLLLNKKFKDFTSYHHIMNNLSIYTLFIALIFVTGGLTAVNVYAQNMSQSANQTGE
jgi:hypothetical protein